MATVKTQHVSEERLRKIEGFAFICIHRSVCSWVPWLVTMKLAELKAAKA